MKPGTTSSNPPRFLPTKDSGMRSLQQVTISPTVQRPTPCTLLRLLDAKDHRACGGTMSWLPSSLCSVVSLPMCWESPLPWYDDIRSRRRWMVDGGSEPPPPWWDIFSRVFWWRCENVRRRTHASARCCPPVDTTWNCALCASPPHRRAHAQSNVHVYAS